MDKKYKIIEDTTTFRIDSNVYPKYVVMKTAYIFIDNFYIFLSMDNNGDLLVEMKHKQGYSASLEMVGEFYNELLNQLLRAHVSEQTKGIREIILARALHQTCIQTEENTTNENILSTSYSIEDIAHDWFATHEDVK